MCFLAWGSRSTGQGPNKFFGQHLFAQLGQNLLGSIPLPAVKLIGELLLTKWQSSTKMTQYMGGQNFFQSDLLKTLTHFACSGINFVSLINLCSCKNMKFRHRFSQLSYQSFIFLLEKFLFGQNGGSTLVNLIPDYWLCFIFIDLSTLENVIMTSWHQTTTNITPNYKN